MSRTTFGYLLDLTSNPFLLVGGAIEKNNLHFIINSMSKPLPENHLDAFMTVFYIERVPLSDFLKRDRRQDNLQLPKDSTCPAIRAVLDRDYQAIDEIFFGERDEETPLEFQQEKNSLLAWLLKELTVRGDPSNYDSTADLLRYFLRKGEGKIPRSTLDDVLAQAAAWGQVETVRLLLAVGASKVNHKALSWALRFSAEPWYSVAKLLIESGTSVSMSRGGHPHLVGAVLCKNLRMAEYICDAGGSSPHLLNRTLHTAACYSSLEMVKFLVRRGADVHEWGPEWNYRDAALLSAAQRLRYKIVDWFISNETFSPESISLALRAACVSSDEEDTDRDKSRIVKRLLEGVPAERRKEVVLQKGDGNDFPRLGTSLCCLEISPPKVRRWFLSQGFFAPGLIPEEALAELLAGGRLFLRMSQESAAELRAASPAAELIAAKLSRDVSLIGRHLRHAYYRPDGPGYFAAYRRFQQNNLFLAEINGEKNTALLSSLKNENADQSL